MKFSTVTLALLVLSLECFGALSLGRDSSNNQGLSSCPSATVVNSTTISVNGHAVQRMTFQCPDGAVSAKVKTASPAGGSSPIVTPAGLSKLARRSSVECKTTGSECQCGQMASCVCDNLTQNSPTGDDCAILMDSLKVIPQLEGPSFLVPFSQIQIIQFQTCAIELENFNLNGGPLEFCWDDLVKNFFVSPLRNHQSNAAYDLIKVFLAGITNENCIERGESTGADCIPNNDLWVFELFRISS
ncbi:uncharacterized protein FOMMEDRAFT_159161 [Fomitiporia mediterranea MF3/22]|uniref:uncharacterized protein n=1 Tax=Fomitiporia mediterranea (strain MF3/22) TaxID=694068 RepID=UPI0004408813|nr:uncharacterized protein FOMMEDRAFT_159161 [Fomitiporia mediterranea MF3/22]EJD00466.1 hypothetical protein FOMMEDRAFT_159161 [Fomitiporia mediterranea MF3/22]